MRTFGKLLQVMGLVILPVAMMMQKSSAARVRRRAAGFSVSTMLVMMVLGVVIFSAGRLLEGYAK